ncbi:MAG TPA: metallophosphoesterase [Terricaulis sp.]|nr:metallophosphoesterase [Terricaulis sp.]
MLLAHFTDLHFGCEHEGAIKAAARYVEENKPDAVIITGDISKDGLQSELEAACDWMRALPAPVILTPGNHDVPYYEPFGRVFFPWRRFNRAAQGIRTEAWHTPEWSIVPVNTARGFQLRANWAQGAISRGQTAIAGAELQKAAPGALRIIITHHPLDWPGDAPIKGVTIGGVRGLERLTNAGAELFLSGHLHFAHARLYGTRALCVSSGTLSQRLRHEPPAFTAIRRPAPNVIEVEVLHVKDACAESATKRRFTLASRAVADAPADIHAGA